MLTNFTQFICAPLPFAFTARYVARVALSAGEFGTAADYYVTSCERLGVDIEGRHSGYPLFPSIVRQCAVAARNIAGMEGQQVKKRRAIVDHSEPEGARLAAIVGPNGHDRSPPDALTTDERLLLAHNQPLLAPELMPDLGAEFFLRLASEKRGIRRFFYVQTIEEGARRAFFDAMKTLDEHSMESARRHLISRDYDLIGTAAVANKKGVLKPFLDSMNALGGEAVHSRMAYRAILRLASVGIPLADEQLSHVHSERHGIFLNRQRMEQEKLEAESDSIRIMRGL